MQGYRKQKSRRNRKTGETERPEKQKDRKNRKTGETEKPEKQKSRKNRKIEEKAGTKRGQWKLENKEVSQKENKRE